MPTESWAPQIKTITIMGNYETSLSTDLISSGRKCKCNSLPVKREHVTVEAGYLNVGHGTEATLCLQNEKCDHAMWMCKHWALNFETSTFIEIIHAFLIYS